MFEATGPGGRIRVYEGCNGFYIEQMRTGEVRGMGDGVDMFFYPHTYNAIPVGTPDFYAALTHEVKHDPDLELAYFPE
jgi:hypothetical protein